MKQFKQSVYQVITLGLLLGGLTYNYAGCKENKKCPKTIINANEIVAEKIKVRNLEVCPVLPKPVHIECPKCPRPTCDQLPVRFLFTMTVPVDTRYSIPNGPSGTRLLVATNTGVFEGPNLKGTVNAKLGGDWLTVRPDGLTALLDARFLLQTEAGEKIYMTYQGIGSFVTGDLRLAPLFQVDSNSPLAFLNDIQAVGIGKVLADAVTFEIFALE